MSEELNATVSHQLEAAPGLIIMRVVPEGCGNPAMIEMMLRILADEGYREHTWRTPGQIHVEKYW